MSGMKMVRGVDLCKAPCCPGYYEHVEEPPFLAPVVYCQQDADKWKEELAIKAAKKSDQEIRRQNLIRYYMGRRK